MKLNVIPLTADAFASFGDVIETANAEHYSINEGTTERFHNLAKIDVDQDGGEVLVNIFRGQPRPLPIEIRMMERHPLGSQAFYPLQQHYYLVVVAPKADIPNIDAIQAFFATGAQGVNYRPNVWHHPLLVLQKNHDFLVIDRGGAGENCDEYYFPDGSPLITLNF